MLLGILSKKELIFTKFANKTTMSCKGGCSFHLIFIWCCVFQPALGYCSLIHFISNHDKNSSRKITFKSQSCLLQVPSQSSCSRTNDGWGSNSWWNRTLMEDYSWLFFRVSFRARQKVLSTSSLIPPSFHGDLTIFHKGNFLKHSPHSKNL